MFNILNTLVFRLVAGTFLSFLIPSAVVAEDTRLDFFEKRIRPVLVSHCYKCHSAESATKGKLKGALALDTRKAMLKGGKVEL